MDKDKIIKDIDRLKELISTIDNTDNGVNYDGLMEISSLLSTVTASWGSYITGDLMVDVMSKLSKGIKQ